MARRTYLGVDIDVDEHGTFSACVNGEYVNNRALSQVKAAIRNAAPTVRVLVKSQYRRFRPLQIRHLASLTELLRGREVGEELDGTQHERDNVFEYDEAVLEKLQQMEQAHDEEVRQLRLAHEQRIANVIASLPPVSTERFAELLEAARNARSSAC